jgi:hypothetical protein
MLTRKDIWALFVAGGLAGGRERGEALEQADALLGDMDTHAAADTFIERGSKRPFHRKPGMDEDEEDE